MDSWIIFSTIVIAQSHRTISSHHHRWSTPTNHNFSPIQEHHKIKITKHTTHISDRPHFSSPLPSSPRFIWLSSTSLSAVLSYTILHLLGSRCPRSPKRNLDSQRTQNLPPRRRNRMTWESAYRHDSHPYSWEHHVTSSNGKKMTTKTLLRATQRHDLDPYLLVTQSSLESRRLLHTRRGYSYFLSSTDVKEHENEGKK